MDLQYKIKYNNWTMSTSGMFKKFFFTILILAFVSLLAFFHFKGVIYYDEGYILNSGLRILQGQIPYRDFDFVYTPISILTTALFLKMFGVSVFAGRVGALVISLLSLLALYKLLKLITKNNLLNLSGLLFFIAWGPAHLNFLWPTMFAICFFLFMNYFFLRGAVEKNKKYFILAGSMVALMFFSKQNFGTGMLITGLLFFVIMKLKNTRIYLSYFIAGVACISLVFLLFFLSTSSFTAFLQNMHVHTLQKIIIEKTIDTPFLYDGSWLTRIGKLLFYTAPLIFSLVAIFIALKRKKKILAAIGIFSGAFYLMGIRPVTDYIHLTPLLSLSCLPLVIIVCYSKNKLIKDIFLLILVGLTVVGFYRAYYAGYYKWDWPLRYHTTFADNPRLRVYLTEEKARNSEELIKYIDTHVAPDEYIFVNYYSPLLYFLADRRNISRFDYVSPTAIPLSYQEDTIKALRKNKVPLVIMNNNNKDEKSLLADFINKNYSKKRAIADYILYTK